MNFKRTLLVFLAGCAAYGGMAACSGGDSQGSGAGGGASSTNASAGSSGGATSGGGKGGAGQGGSAFGGHGGTGGNGGGNGTRLKRYFSKATDGATDAVIELNAGEEFPLKPRQRWFDSERNEDCMFVPTSDNKYHCLPIGMNTGLAYIMVNGQCEQHAGIRNGECAPHKYYVELDNPLCPPPVPNPAVAKVYKMGAFIMSTECTFRDDTCTTGQCGTPSLSFYETGSEVDLDAFVSAVPTTDP